ncbi:hypothetical protein V8E54_010395 [Elaphomyces granulatus]
MRWVRTKPVQPLGCELRADPMQRSRSSTPENPNIQSGLLTSARIHENQSGSSSHRYQLEAWTKLDILMVSLHAIRTNSQFSYLTLWRDYTNNAFFFGHSVVQGLRDLHPRPMQAMTLWEAYQENVAPMVTILHRPPFLALKRASYDSRSNEYSALQIFLL